MFVHRSVVVVLLCLEQRISLRDIYIFYEGVIRTFVLLPSPPRKDLQQLIMASVLFMPLQRLDIRLLQQLGEDVCILGGGRLRDEIRCGTR